MGFDGNVSHAAATGSGNNRPTMGLRDFLQEILAVGMIASVASIVWTLIEIKGVIARSQTVDNQIIKISHSTAALADRATAQLDEFEFLKTQSIPDLGFRAAPSDSKPPADEDSHNPHPSPTQQQPLFPLPE